MRSGMYFHPWDVVDEGARNVFSFISRTRMEFINLAVSYHSGRFFLPHNPTKKCVECGAVIADSDTVCPYSAAIQAIGDVFSSMGCRGRGSKECILNHFQDQNGIYKPRGQLS